MKTSILLFLLCSSLFIQAQNELRNNDLFYSISVGAGMGKAPNFQNIENGIGGVIDFTLQKNKTVASIGFRGAGEFQLLGSPSPSNTMTSLDLLYGKVLTDKKVIVSIHTGIGLVGSLERGEFLYADPGLFGQSHYEKVRSFTVGLPISTKVLLSISKHFGLGLEGYTNINSKNIFYGLNLYATFKKYKLSIKEKS